MPGMLRRNFGTGYIDNTHPSHVETVCCLYHQKKDFISVPYEPKDAEYLNKMGKSKPMEAMKR